MHTGARRGAGSGGRGLGAVTFPMPLQDTAADQKFAASALKDVALLTCKSRAAELARQTEEEARAFAAAETQDQEELKAIEARIRDVRKETAAERRSLQDFQVRAVRMGGWFLIDRTPPRALAPSSVPPRPRCAPPPVCARPMGPAPVSSRSPPDQAPLHACVPDADQGHGMCPAVPRLAQAPTAPPAQRTCESWR